jgi:hypothetical protein
MQGFVPVMWSVWGAVVFLLIALKVYSGRLTRDEDDQIILDDSFNHVRSEQAAIVEKVHRIEPIMRVMKWVVVACTAGVIAYYCVDFYRHFQ